MGEFDAAGEIVTGALLGRAVEPHAGEHGGHGLMCLNCGTALIGAHCHRCGQSAHVHRSLGAIGHEILHGVAHFEGKLWRTLPLLVWRPGELTRRYVEGERARFVSPMAFFLFSIFVMFAVFQIAGISPPADMNIGGADSAIAQAREALTSERKDALHDKADSDTSPAEQARLDQRIAKIDRQLAELALVQPAEEHITVTPRHTGWARLDHGFEKWQKNPSLMLYKLQSSSYKFSWLLIPLSLPFVWLLFAWRREYQLYDHTVFITYSIAFMSLLFIAVTILAAIGLGGAWLAFAALIIPLVHLYRQLRQAYALGRVSAGVRTVVLTGFIGVVLILFIVLLVLLGMVG